MTSRSGTLYLVPNTLDFGADDAAAAALDDVLPRGVIRVAAGLPHWIAENAKTTRAFLKRVGALVPLASPLQTIDIVELPRPPKGARASVATAELDALLAPARRGHDVGLIAEAGLPAVADPGALVVAAAHRLGIEVKPLAGASSLVLALAASGHNGQNFAFVGYLPTEPAARGARIRALEALSRRESQTQLVIETPYRNAALLAALLEHLQGSTRLATSSALTWTSEQNRSDSIEAWRARPSTLPSNAPVVFSIFAG